MSIQYLTYQQIDKVKWDRCLMESSNGLIYSSSIYLDHMAANWDGLVLNDYEAIMPLPWKKKWGIHYMYPPAFTQQLGISSSQNITEEISVAFLQAIPKKFKYLEANLNANNPITGNFALRKNYLLFLDAEYATLRKNYSRSARRNIAQAEADEIKVVENAKPQHILHLHRERFKDEIGSNQKDYEHFLKLIQQLNSSGQCYCVAASNSKGNLIAGSIYTMFKDRVTFVINGNSNESLASGATHLLMDHTIKHFSGRPLVLDFEGSDHINFARFYEQYGARPEFYPFVRRNRLPWPVRLLKPADTSYDFQSGRSASPK